ncbi:PGF-CTERM sorting domain-containing protein [Halocalculus aciditolerans]|uniref:PGF-CTERM sorting domain-containing protein n=1 Tax=Halocalculus aciditolerans TaxID=1383812 RepID=UPI001664B6D2|nr:PGF-CTERM sorting domain-containing protein [Halocalculus aciditolerans]
MALAAVTGFAAAASAGSVTSSPADANATVTHTATATVTDGAAGGSLTGFAVNYSWTDVSTVGQGDIAKVGIDRGDDQSGAAIDVDVSNSLGSVNADDNGHALLVGLDGSYSPHAGDEVVVVYENVQNPSAGSYDVGLDVNPQSSGGETTATLDVGTQSNSAGTNDGSADTSDADTSSQTTGDDTANTDSPTDSPQTTTRTQSPGFGVAAGMAALFGAALVALRLET